MKRGRIFVISAPSGTGKTTLVSRLLAEMPGKLSQSISCTTRPPRAGEKEGVDYCFIDDKEFELHKRQGDFLELAEIYGYKYGTLKQSIRSAQNEGKDLLLVIDVNGADQLRRLVDATYIFICPPSLEELERRIRGRKKDSSEMIAKRLAKAKEEMDRRFEYDYVIVNDDIETALIKLKEIIGENNE